MVNSPGHELLRCTSHYNLLPHARTHARTHTIACPDSSTELRLSHQIRSANVGFWYVEFKHELLSPRGLIMGQRIISALWYVKLYQFSPRSTKFAKFLISTISFKLMVAFPKTFCHLRFQRTFRENLRCWFYFWVSIAGNIN